MPYTCTKGGNISISGDGAFRRTFGVHAFSLGFLYEQNDRLHSSGVWELKRVSFLTLDEYVMFLSIPRGFLSVCGCVGLGLSP